MQYVPLQGLDLALYPKQDAAKSRPMHRLIHVFPIEADVFHYESSCQSPFGDLSIFEDSHSPDSRHIRVFVLVLCSTAIFWPSFCVMLCLARFPAAPGLHVAALGVSPAAGNEQARDKI